MDERLKNKAEDLARYLINNKKMYDETDVKVGNITYTVGFGLIVPNDLEEE